MIDKIKVTSLGGRCCDVRSAANRNIKQIKTGADEMEKIIDRKYNSYSDLIA